VRDPAVSDATIDLDRYLSDGAAQSLVVLRDGSLFCEWYGNGGGADDAHPVFSVSKTVLSLAVARAVEQGVISSIDMPITDVIPELGARDPRFRDVSLASLIDMRSGVHFGAETAFPWVNQDQPSVYYATDLRSTVLERTWIETAPGPFVYNDYAPNLIGLALERASGEPLASGIFADLWVALDAEGDASWSVDDHGFAWHESGLIATSRDLARVGQLMLDDGMVGETAVAPAAFLDRSYSSLGQSTATSFAGHDVGYSNGWWTVASPTGGRDLVAMSAHGQIILVSPSTGTVIVRTSIENRTETNIAMVSTLQDIAAGFDGRDTPPG
jgi:CubicO group peptidase (beta-lactamase class C family)